MKLMELVSTLTMDASDFAKGVNEATKKGSALSGVISKIGDAAAALGKAAAVGVSAAAAGLGALLKSSIDDYAEYEQLVGGVETLFKDSSDTIMAYANKAYQTAGLSANDYMQTVTGFSASLLQSLGGDTEKAAAQADKALTDMADNANKMGTAMDSIQYAYQGFAKQNYTMLDNLKLGYGGTKQEMERLLEDASKIAGVKFDISSYSDIIEAIHVIQEDMGIAGTTAKEATETISGSFAALQSTWKNLKTGLSDGNANVDLLIKNLIGAGKTYAKNIAKVIPDFAKNIGEAASSLWEVIEDGVEKVAEKIPGWMQTLRQRFSTAWKMEAYPAIQQLFKAKFDVELPEWSEVTNRISNFWSQYVSPVLGGLKGVALSVFMPEKSPDGTPWVDRIGNWLNGITGSVADLGGIALKLIFPETDADGASWVDKAVGWVKDVSEIVSSSAGITLRILGVEEWSEEEAGKLKDFRTKLQPVLDKIGTFTMKVFAYIDPWSPEHEAAAQNWRNSVSDFYKFVIEIAFPSIQDTVNKTNEWFNDVKDRLSLTIPASFSYASDVQKVVDSTPGGQIFTTNSDSPGISNFVNWLFKPHATGLDYVPYNNYRALLHEGESVLTKAEATEWRRGESSGMDAKALANEFSAAVVPALLSALNGASVQMDGQTVGRIVTPFVSREIAAEAYIGRF